MIRNHPHVMALERAELSETTKDQYIINANLIHEKCDRQPLEIIYKYPEWAFDKIRAAYPSKATQRSMASTVRALMKHSNTIQQYRQYYDKWLELGNEVAKQIDDHYLSNKMTDEEAAKWVTWDEIQGKERDLASKEFASTRHLLLACYVLMDGPLRQNLGAVRLLAREPSEIEKKKLETTNYLILSDPCTLVINVHKTAKHYGPIVRVLPADLTGIVRKNLENDPRRYLFVDKYRRPYDRARSFAAFSGRVFEDIFGKKVGVNIIRHSFVSNIDFNAKTAGELQTIAKAMGHSLQQQQLYRRKPTEDQLTALQVPNQRQTQHSPGKKPFGKPLGKPPGNAEHVKTIVLEPPSRAAHPGTLVILKS